jgi:hypothetical protein
MAECLTRPDHGLNGFLLIIVGRCEPPEGLHVSIHDRGAGGAGCCGRPSPGGLVVGACLSLGLFDARGAGASRWAI